MFFTNKINESMFEVNLFLPYMCVIFICELNNKAF